MCLAWILLLGVLYHYFIITFGRRNLPLIFLLLHKFLVILNLVLIFGKIWLLFSLILGVMQIFGSIYLIRGVI